MTLVGDVLDVIVSTGNKAGQDVQHLRIVNAKTGKPGWAADDTVRMVRGRAGP
jgi:hypothetical protein